MFKISPDPHTLQVVMYNGVVNGSGSLWGPEKVRKSVTL